MVTAYLDESKDGPGKQVLVLAGYIGRDEDWEHLRTQWARLLEMFEIREFHATDCEAGWGDFAHMSGSGRTKLQWRFVRLLSDPANEVIGHLSAVDLRPYVPLLPRFKSARRIPPGQAVNGDLGDPYFLALQLAVEFIAKSAWVSALPPEEKVEFVLDETSLGGRARALYESIKNDKNFSAWTGRLGGVRLLSSAKCLPLQAADLWAYEARRFSEQRFTGGAAVKRWHFLELAQGIDWHSAMYFDETGVHKVLELLEGSRTTDRTMGAAQTT